MVATSMVTTNMVTTSMVSVLKNLKGLLDIKFLGPHMATMVGKVRKRGTQLQPISDCSCALLCQGYSLWLVFSDLWTKSVTC